MNERYYIQLIEVLLHKPKGLRLSTIVTNIYNMNVGLFSSSELYDEIYMTIQRFLNHEYKKKGSVFYRTPNKRGYYAVHRNKAKLLLLQLTNQIQDPHEQ